MLTVKNSSMSTENGVTYLRINFHVPGAISKEVSLPTVKGPGALFIKEITLKSNQYMNLQSLHKQIKDTLKLIKQDQAVHIKAVDSKDED